MHGNAERRQALARLNPPPHLRPPAPAPQYHTLLCGEQRRRPVPVARSTATVTVTTQTVQKENFLHKSRSAVVPARRGMKVHKEVVVGIAL